MSDTDTDTDYEDQDDNLIEDAADDGGSDQDDDDEYYDDELAPTAIAVCDYLCCQVVEDPDSVRVDAEDTGRAIRLTVTVGPEDMGRVIGKRGRVANAIRTVVRAAAVKDDVEIEVEFEQ